MHKSLQRRSPGFELPPRRSYYQVIVTRGEDIARIMKASKVGRARAEAIYARREARHADFEWRKVQFPDETKAPKPEEG
jgi:hypothetical protein